MSLGAKVLLPRNPTTLVLAPPRRRHKKKKKTERRRMPRDSRDLEKEEDFFPGKW